MQLPMMLPAKPRHDDTKAELAVIAHEQASRDGLVQAGCCLQVCAPIIGCHCVVEGPFC
jgi:hypothetical protein